MALVYHEKYNIFTCVCEEVINAEHTCKIKVSNIEVVVCTYVRGKNTDKFCSICDSREKQTAFADQWEWYAPYRYMCVYCDSDTDGGLPKECCCTAFIDEDGEKKCKTCKTLWTQGTDMEEECIECLQKIFDDQWDCDESGRFRCAECGEDTDGRSLPKKCSCTAFIDHDGLRKCKNCRERWVNDTMREACDSCNYWQFIHMIRKYILEFENNL